MRHIRAFVITLAVLAVIAFLALFPGQASVRWLGYQVDFPVTLVWVAIALVAVMTVNVMRLWDAVVHMPLRMQGFLEKRRTHKAEKMLLEGLTALAAQQLDEARSCVAFAQKLIPHHPLTAYVAAQSAHLAKDAEQARTSFVAMTQHASVAFLGYRGLIQQAQADQDWHRVQQLLHTVFEDRPDSPWVIQTILRNALYLAAKEVLSPEVHTLLKSVYRALAKQQSKRHEALVLWLQSQHIAHHGKIDMLHQAHERDASIAPVAATLADMLSATDARHARKVLRKTLSLAPHRLLYGAWVRAHGQLPPVKLYADLAKEVSGEQRHNIEINWLLFKAAIEAHMWGQAELHSHVLLEGGDDRDVCLALAGMYAAQHEPNDHCPTVWQARALDAMWTHFWICETCSAGMVNWHPICPSCRGTDTLTWKRHPLKEVWHVDAHHIAATSPPALLAHNGGQDMFNDTKDS